MNNLNKNSVVSVQTIELDVDNRNKKFCVPIYKKSRAVKRRSASPISNHDVVITGPAMPYNKTPSTSLSRYGLSTSKTILKRVKSPVLEEIKAPSSTFDSNTCREFSLRGERARIYRPETRPTIHRRIKPFVGKCTLKDTIKRPTYAKNEYKPFSLTEDPRKKYCLVNPKFLENKNLSRFPTMKEIIEDVKVADNMDTPSISLKSISSICEIIDVENPLNLDFHGLDYQNTFKSDEQDFQNQREYRRVRRYVERRDTKAEIILKMKENEHKELLTVPNAYDITHEFDSNEEKILSSIHDGDSDTISEARDSLPPIKYAQLCRTEDKPLNLEMKQMEIDQREGRYENLQYNKMYRLKKDLEEQKAIDDKRHEFEGMDIGEMDFKTFIEVQQQKIKQTVLQTIKQKDQRKYPHTLGETIRLKREMKRNRRIIRDKARIKQEYYQSLGFNKLIREANLEVSSESILHSGTISELSSDDEDNLEVGQKGNKYYLRGFHYRLGSNPRGKLHQKQKTGGERHQKGCISRTEWFDMLAPKPEKLTAAVTNVSTVYRLQDPDDPNMDLFGTPEFAFEKPAVAPIRLYKMRPIGNQYEHIYGKRISIKKPNTLKVKKFNLVSYMHGESKPKRRPASEKSASDYDLDDLNEYIEVKAKAKRVLKHRKRRQRMHYLGLPCLSPNHIRTRRACARSESENSDWIPAPPNAQISDSKHSSKFSIMTIRGSNAVPVALTSIKDECNMPAPKFREPTLRHHPGLPRNCDELQIPSKELMRDQERIGVPYIKKLSPDRIKTENIRGSKGNNYMTIFEGRHHHDHWDPTQHKVIDVRYETKIPELDVIESNVPEHLLRKKRPPFNRAYPVGKEFDMNADLTMPKKVPLDLRKMRGIGQRGAGGRDDVDDGIIKDNKPNIQQNACEIQDMIYRSRDDEANKLDYPGKLEFRRLILDMSKRIVDGYQAHSSDKDSLAVDEDVYLGELEEDLKSIRSCLSSLESSICTNFTNDSGSFIMIENHKVPLDFVRKALVPFEEINRSRFKATPILLQQDEYLNPYRAVPYAGQKIEQVKISGPNDKLYTFNTRLRNNLRFNLEVPPRNIRKLLLGTDKNSGYPEVANDLDELYISDLTKRPTMKCFRRITTSTLIKDSLRKKFEAWVIQGKVVEQKIAERKEEQYALEITSMQDLFEKLFSKWEKKEYESSMAAIHKVKPYYDATDYLLAENKELEKVYTLLNMDIVYIENDWIRRTILQNFHYLIMDFTWREQFDWIHRDENGMLEGFAESIEKRPFVNIRSRDRDDAWAIKEFYDDHYTQNLHEIHIVFSDPEKLRIGIEELKSKTFVSILELHYTMWILVLLQKKYYDFKDWCAEELEAKKKYAEKKMEKKYFMEDRAKCLEKYTKDVLNESLPESVSSQVLYKIRGLIDVIFVKTVPRSMRNALQQDAGSLDQICMISSIVIDLVRSFELIPVDKAAKVEAIYRRRLAYEQRLSHQAFLTEKRIESGMRTVKRNLAPAYVKPKRIGKLPHTRLKKRVVVVPKEELVISDKTKFFYNAFHDDDEVIPVDDARDSIEIMDTIQDSIVPFYFDHFLRLNDYTPNYNFKTKVETRDGPEESRFSVVSVLPEVKLKMHRWKLMKQQIMEDNIKNNPQMYQNVNT